MDFSEYLDTLSNSDIGDLDEKYFTNIVRYGSIKHVIMYASMNTMQLSHCAIVIHYRESIYPEFVKASGLSLKKILRTFGVISPKTCGEVLSAFGLHDPVFSDSTSYINYVCELCASDAVYQNIISGSSLVSVSDIPDHTAKRFFSSREQIELLVNSIE
jgi:hypothetical protein